MRMKMFNVIVLKVLILYNHGEKEVAILEIMKVIKETKYLVFEEQEISINRKTKIIHVTNIRHDDVIGVIKWYSAWRQYCFFPEIYTVWNTTCLDDVQDVIRELMQDRKTEK